MTAVLQQPVVVRLPFAPVYFFPAERAIGRDRIELLGAERGAPKAGMPASPVRHRRTTTAFDGCGWSRFGPTVPFATAAASVAEEAQSRDEGVHVAVEAVKPVRAGRRASGLRGSCGRQRADDHAPHALNPGSSRQDVDAAPRLVADTFAVVDGRGRPEPGHGSR